MRTTSSRPGIGKIIFNYGELAEQLGINGQIIGVHERGTPWR